MAAKLKIEWDESPDKLIVTKKKGKITFDELMRFFHERDQINAFDGSLITVAFRVNAERDMYSFMDEVYGEPEGDTLTVYVVGDESKCPICGNIAYTQYCPECGRKLFGKE